MNNQNNAVYLVFRSLILPVFVLMCIGLLYYLTLPFFSGFANSLVEKTKLIIAYGIGIIFWFSIAWFICRCIDNIIWEYMLYNRSNIRIPQLIKQLTRIIIYFITSLLIISMLFGQSILGIVAASGMVTLILGLSLDNLIADLFAGLLMSIDSPFDVHDMLYIHDRPLQSTTATVLEITWRATYLLNLSDNILVIPNSLFSSMTITNLSKTKSILFVYRLSLDQTIPVHRVKRILTAAAIATPGVYSKPAPWINLTSIDEGKYNYLIYCHLDRNKTSPNRFKHDFASEIIHGFRVANIDFFVPKQVSYDAKSNAYAHDSELFNLRKYIEWVDWAQLLTASELDHIAKNAAIVELKKGQHVITINTQGESLFIVKEGLLEVLLTAPSEEELQRVAYLAKGDVFGTMSLLTGEPRSATVVCKTDCTLIEINKAVIAPIFEKNEALILTVSKVIAARKLANEAKLQEILDSQQSEAIELNLIEKIFAKIKQFFQLGIKQG